MQHIAVKATTTVTDTDLGQFEAIVSAWDADREGDTIKRSAFDKTISAWRESGKNLPLLFEHKSVIVGHVDPHSMHASDSGLVVAGEVDRSTDEGRQAWRSIKSGTAGFSIGFMSESRALPGGGRELTEVDLLEISFTAKPMHAATRALSWKAADRGFDFHMPSDKGIREEAQRREIAKLAKSAQAPIRTASFDC
jgi:HK97 family phage prohead protease